MPFVDVNRCKLYYEIHGSGPVLALIHGETHGIEMFKSSIEHFKDRFTCLSYYRRGHGNSEMPPYGYSLWNQTVDFAALMDELKIEKATLVGVAMSTPLVVTYALNYPDRVRAMVLASWYEIEGYPALEKQRKTGGIFMGELRMQMEEILASKGRAGLEAFIERETERLFPIFPKQQPALGNVIRMFASHAPGHYVKSAEYYTSLPNLLPQMHQVKCPILGICGDEDPSPDKPELLQHLPQFREVWIKGARRFTMMESPEAFNAAIEGFLGELRS